MIAGARKLPAHHITIRVPWHDAGWDGTVCGRPRDNTHCLVLKRIGTSKRDDHELACAGRSVEDLPDADLPPCIDEHGSFMAPFEIARTKRHPYAETSRDTHGHFAPTRLRIQPHSAACVPFRWMLRQSIEGDADQKLTGLANELKLGFVPQREPELSFNTPWIQDRENQLVLLDTFFGALEERTSLCFFYAKRTPLSDDPRRVIVGVGRVVSVGPPTEYAYDTKTPPLRGVLWERCVAHSIRPSFVDGFLFPYRELLAAAAEDPSLALGDLVAFAPNDFFANYSFGSELLPHDGAIASLVECASVLRRLGGRVPGPWGDALAWVDRELNRIWKARGPFPGLGSALCAFGLEHGNLIAYEIAAAQMAKGSEWSESPWQAVERVMLDPAVLPAGVASSIGETFRKKWKALPPARRAHLELLSRFAISREQATRYFVAEERGPAGIVASDEDLLSNPYLFYQLDRTQPDPIAVDTVDRGMFPDPVIREAFPVPPKSAMTDAIDPRRVTALTVDTLELAADEGSTLLPRAWLVQRIRERALNTPCPLDEDTLRVTESELGSGVLKVSMAGGREAFQLDRFADARRIIADVVRKRVGAARHGRKFDWAEIVERSVGSELPGDADEREAEVRARREKAAALEEVYASRFSVLVGPAGTGKTTLLRALCDIEEVSRGGILLLAPTGKARVRLEEATGLRGDGKTLAQFLNGLKRFDGATGRYFPNPTGPKPKGAKTVVVDECSMLTEEQLAALLDALQGVERLVLVGDPRQLPPIGAGRPFVDIVDHLTPPNVEATFPRKGQGYAELTVTRRQKGEGRDDLLLAAHFSGRPMDPGADEIWDRLAHAGASGLRLVEWHDSPDLEAKLLAELVRVLKLGGPDDEPGFELSIGGSSYGETGGIFFWAGRNGAPGAAAKCADWQILSPLRGTQHGVDALNRAVQARFRKRALSMATPESFWQRKIPRPMGPLGILWGDKVINVVNNGKRRTWPKSESPFVANGDIGIVVGEYKTKTRKGLPQNLEVEFTSQPGLAYTYWASEFSEDGSPPLELAYALTVHKTQGSEFGTTFVVLPNPCRLLSRELLYTALTRHQQHLVLLHQGPVRELRRYAEEAHSEIARRMTNLFRDADPREVNIGGKARTFLEDRLIFRTERGDLVRSKSEVILADKMHARKIDYAYEAPLVLDGVERYPDFTIVDDDTGVTFYWEHLGMLDVPEYRRRWDAKLAAYKRAGILPSDDGGGPSGTLVITRDAPGGGLDAQAIAALIDKVILRR